MPSRPARTARRRTLLAALFTGAILLPGVSAQKLGTFDFTPSRYFKYLSASPALNIFQCGAGSWAMTDPAYLSARGQARTEGFILTIELNPASWQLENNYRGRELPITSVEIITDAANGQPPLRYIYKPSQLRYDTRAHLVTLVLPPVANQTRFVLGKINLADKACSGSALFLVNSIGG